MTNEENSFGLTQKRYEKIPNELKTRRQWVCYRIVEKDGKKRKIPYCADKAGLRCAKTNDPTTWHSFEEVVEAASKPNNRFDGIEFVMPENNPYVFIDYDHVVDDGFIEEWVQQDIDKIGSYTEFSQSGTGIHIFAKAKKPGPRCKTLKRPKFEIYDNVRMVVFTGNVVSGSQTEIIDAQKAVDDIYFKVFGDNPCDIPTKELAKNLLPLGMSDFELIEKARNAKNGDKFERLWNGNTGDYNGDDSSADIAFCCRLAFWTQRDPERMDRIFRESGLMREKWDQKRGGKTYGEMTINKAILQTREVYKSSSQKSEKSKFTEDELTTIRKKIGQAKNTGTASAVFNIVDSLTLLSPGEFADVTKDLKDVIPQLDCRELKSAVSRAKKSKCASEKGDYPILVVSNRQDREIVDDAIKLLERSNIPPKIFVRSGALCQVIEDEYGHLIIRTITEDILLSILAKICNFMRKTEEGLKDVSPSKRIASNILSETNWPFPTLESIKQSPTIRTDGSIAQLPGYDTKTKLYYHTANDDKLPIIPENPTQADREASLQLINELLQDFPFDSQASKANTIALLLSPLIQPAIMDVIPLVLIDAPTQGNGKSLLATITGIIANGVLPDFTTAPTKEEEWPKKITALLSAGPTLVVIDNVKQKIQSADFAALLTAQTWKERILGKNNKIIISPNRAVWVATGNNIQLGGDIGRRCIWIRLDSKQAKPYERENFLHPDIKQWVLDNRGRLLWALLTLCRAWYAAGCPNYTIPTFGSYEKWSRTVGSILVHAGINGFLENRNKLREQADTESIEWEAFLSSWIELYGNTPISLKELVQDIEVGGRIAETVPASISDAINSESGIYQRIGIQFTARLERRYGPRGLRLEKGQRRNSGFIWMVLEEETTSECMDDNKLFTNS